MAKKQKSFADKAAENTAVDSVYVKYVRSVQSEKTGKWRFNEQMVRMNKGEQLDAALKRMDEAMNLIDIDLSEFSSQPELDTITSKQKLPESDLITGKASNVSGAEVANEIQSDDATTLSDDEASSSEEE